MRPLRAFFLFGLSFLGAGCALFTDVSRNIGVGMLRSHEARREWRRDYRWAERAWAKNCTAAGGSHASKAYANGFKDGFAEYLFRGGNGEPPLVAPLRYRRLCKQTPCGYQAIDDWFMGYRHGASVARASGVREWITGPSSLHSLRAGATPPAGLPVMPPSLGEYCPNWKSEGATPPDVPAVMTPDDPEKPPLLDDPEKPPPELPPPRPTPESTPPEQSAASALEFPNAALELPAKEPAP